MTFVGSAFLHVYPLAIVGCSMWSILLMAAFFIVQIPLVMVEYVFGFESRIWFHFSFISSLTLLLTAFVEFLTLVADLEV